MTLSRTWAADVYTYGRIQSMPGSASRVTFPAASYDAAASGKAVYIANYNNNIHRLHRRCRLFTDIDAGFFLQQNPV